jgi:TonB family protein
VSRSSTIVLLPRAVARLGLVLAAALVGGVAHAQGEPVAPKLLKTTPAQYSAEGTREHIEGEVVVELAIDTAGAVSDARVLTGLGHGLDEAALRAARQYVFAPATQNGVPIASTLELTISFHPPATRKAAPVEVVQSGTDQRTVVVAQRPAPMTTSLHEPEHIAASDTETKNDELMLRPRLRTENVLEAVPGLFTVQHAGGGKAQQYFMRGFDLDHGTDLAFFIDGVPINAVSHGHGQGYSDLHFIIPETIGTLESTKGPYSPRVGDFATAGSVTFHMLDRAEDSFAKLEVGPYAHVRGVALASPNLGDRWHALAAVEAFNDDGPFVHPDNFNRFNAYLKVSHRLDDVSTASMLFTGYGGSWNMSGVLPARAVCGEGDGTPVPTAYAGSHCLNRWDSVDPSQGGSAQRFMALASYARRFPHGDLEASVYVVHSNLQLFPNDGIASALQPAGLLYGSQIEQDDTRTEMGLNARYTKTVKVDRFDVRTTLGLQFRDDIIESQLHRTEERVRLDGMPGIPGPITDSGINESEIGAYAEADWHVTKWMRFVLGGRADRIDVAVSNESPTAVDQVAGYKGAAQFSPKASMVVSPAKWLDLFANYGRGFHSNDARTIIEGAATTLVATATGYELGATVRPLKGLSASAVAFLLDITSELTINGDTASTSPAGPTRRIGGELSLRYELRRDIYVDAALTIARARYTDAADIAAGTDYVALAPVATFSAGAGARHQFGPITLFGSVQVRGMSDRPATQDNTLTATGFVLVNAELGARWKHVELAGELLNIGDVTWREGQFAVNARLPLEGPNPPTGISFTPGIPRTLLGHLALYW